MQDNGSVATTERKSVANAKEIYSILEKQNFCCALSGSELQIDDASLDHIIPVSKGGTHEASNLQIVTKNINRMKGTLSNDEFIAICKMVAERHHQSGSPLAIKQ